VEYLAASEPVEVFGRFFMLTLVYNAGGALGSNLGSPTYYLISSMLILIVVLVYGWFHRQQPRLLIPLALVAGGATGNIADRIRLGQVIDFLDVDFFDINLGSYHLDRWWTFNVADAAISVAIVALLIHLLFTPLPPKVEEATAVPTPPDSLAG
jgi:signal peptidase II